VECLCRRRIVCKTAGWQSICDHKQNVDDPRTAILVQHLKGLLDGKIHPSLFPHGATVTAPWLHVFLCLLLAASVNRRVCMSAGSELHESHVHAVMLDRKVGHELV